MPAITTPSFSSLTRTGRRKSGTVVPAPAHPAAPDPQRLVRQPRPTTVNRRILLRKLAETQLGTQTFMRHLLGRYVYEGNGTLVGILDADSEGLPG